MSDYERIAEAISYLTKSLVNQPTLEEVAAHLHLSPFHFQRLFSRWAGVTPKKFLQILTVKRAKQLLSESKSLLEVSGSLGLSSGSRLYDHFVNLEAATPGEFKNGGIGMVINYGVHDSPFGLIFIAMTQRGICKISFLDSNNINYLLVELKNKWPNAELIENEKRTQSSIEIMFGNEANIDRPLSLYVTGTNFQINVWKALLKIPSGMVVSYGQLAETIGHPRSARAVGTAIGANPAAFIIPCHRVIQQSGKLGGYHWGENRLHAIHAWETARKSAK